MAAISYDSSVHITADGARSVRTVTGAQVIKTASGRYSIDMNHVKAVGIKNVVEVESYEIHTVANSRSHFVRFHGKGELKFAYNSAGQLLELGWENLNFVLTADDELIFSRLRNASH